MMIQVKIDGEIFSVEVGDLNARPVRASVGGETFEVWPEENTAPAFSPTRPPANGGPHGEPAAQPGSPRREGKLAPDNQSTTIQAPIPGVILSVSVRPGDAIAFGQELCVLEAMKMKNIIRANRAGKIGAVCVEPGDQVRHGQALIEFAE